MVNTKGFYFMTPSQLRVRADSFMESARCDINAGRIDNAMHNAGLAAELALKARICTMNGWSAWPETNEEAKALGYTKRGLHIHELQTLLTLSNSIRIPFGTSIEWQQAIAWDHNDRYEPTGTADRETTVKFVADVATMLQGLRLHEFIRTMQRIHVQVAECHSWFRLFSLVEHSPKEQFFLRVSADWIDDGLLPQLRSKFKGLRDYIDADLRTYWVGTNVVSTDHAEVLALNGLIALRGPDSVVWMENNTVNDHRVSKQFLLASGTLQRPPQNGSPV